MKWEKISNRVLVLFLALIMLLSLLPTTALASGTAGVVLENIAVAQPPDKTSYYVGEELDLTGLLVTGTYSDYSTGTLSITMDDISGFDSSAAVDGQTVTVTCEGKTATFTVDIKAVEYTYEYFDDYTAQITGYSGSDTNVVIPDKVTSNGKVYTVTSIGDSAFEGCYKMASVVVPEGVVSIGRDAFDYLGLAQIDLPSTLTTIGESAFSDCTCLTSIALPSSLVTIGGNAFFDCTDLTTVEIPSGVTSIGGGAFQNCTGLQSISLPSSLAAIPESIFCGCTGLTAVKIPSGVTTIDSNAFDGCTGLTSIEIPSGMTSIGMSAFNLCTGLSSVEIPASVTSINYGAFMGCKGLKGVYFLGQMPTFGSTNIFYNTPNCVVYYPLTQQSSWDDFTMKEKKAFILLTLDLQNSSASKSVYAVVTEGLIAEPASPSRAGYTFGGWYKDAAGQNVFDFDTETVSGDVTLYAKWQKDSAWTVTGVSLDKTSDTITVGGSDTLTATVAPDNAANKNVTWTSSNPSVATVVYGVITAVSDGTATITATTTDGGFTATCLVTVQAVSGGGSGCDLNGDGKVNVQDLVLVGQHIPETGTPGWIVEDINKDGIVNVQDLVLVGQNLTS